MKQQITATGVKGFLKWLQSSNPALYAKVAAELPQKMPQLFAQFEQAGGLSGLAKRVRSKMNRLGQTGFTGWGTGTGSTNIGATTGSTAIASTGFTGAGWSTGATAPGSTAPPAGYGTGSTGTAQNATAGELAAGAPAIDVADAANPGPLSSPDAISLGQIVSDVASATQSVAAAQATSAIANAQIARAQSGLAPLPLAIPGVTSSLATTSLFGMSGSTLLWVGGGAVVLLLLMSGKSRG
jgi:hypothetical protein